MGPWGHAAICRRSFLANAFKQFAGGLVGRVLWHEPPLKSLLQDALAKVGRTLDVIIDVVDEEGGATGRSEADAPEIDGEVFLRDAAHLKQGDIVPVRIEEADEHDLYGVPVN